jgi:hypothetical protein
MQWQRWYTSLRTYDSQNQELNHRWMSEARWGKTYSLNCARMRPRSCQYVFDKKWQHSLTWMAMYCRPLVSLHEPLLASLLRHGELLQEPSWIQRQEVENGPLGHVPNTPPARAKKISKIKHSPEESISIIQPMVNADVFEGCVEHFLWAACSH